MKRSKTAKLELEINKALDVANVKRRQRDNIERPTVPHVLGRIDFALSSAQDQTTNLANAETRVSSPQAYEIGIEIHNDLEALRRKLRKLGRG